MTSLLQVKDLKKYFPSRGGILNRVVNNVQAVNDVTFDVREGEVVGLVGESGSGKTTVGRTLLRLEEATSGTVTFDGTDILTLPKEDMRKFRKRMQIIFQDPYASLNPREKIRAVIGHALTQHQIGTPEDREDRIVRLLEQVGLSADYMDRFPHEFSGGQRQRICIARALASEPELIVCDEAVSALDVSVKAQIINLLEKLQQELGLALLFISHDLAVVEHMTHRVAVMYLGKIVEVAEKRAIFANPRHPYTKALLSAVPVPEPGAARKRMILKGDVPSPINPPSGCRFHKRCPFAFDRCAKEEPQLRKFEGGHLAACHLDTIPENS
jgi:oligopeptide/dipeptide ABC transporter ATP-binding protein